MKLLNLLSMIANILVILLAQICVYCLCAVCSGLLGCGTANTDNNKIPISATAIDTVIVEEPEQDYIESVEFMHLSSNRQLVLLGARGSGSVTVRSWPDMKIVNRMQLDNINNQLSEILSLKDGDDIKNKLSIPEGEFIKKNSATDELFSKVPTKVIDGVWLSEDSVLLLCSVGVIINAGEKQIYGKINCLLAGEIKTGNVALVHVLRIAENEAVFRSLSLHPNNYSVVFLKIPLQVVNDIPRPYNVDHYTLLEANWKTNTIKLLCKSIIARNNPETIPVVLFEESMVFYYLPDKDAIYNSKDSVIYSNVFQKETKQEKLKIVSLTILDKLCCGAVITKEENDLILRYVRNSVNGYEVGEINTNKTNVLFCWWNAKDELIVIYKNKSHVFMVRYCIKSLKERI